jgi:uncharacterized protein YjiS (DUF1127 family)
MNPIAAFADTQPMQWPALQPRRVPSPDAAVDLATLLGAVSRWLEWAHSRRALDELDDHLLKDIGLTRAEARREAGKSFWRL